MGNNCGCNFDGEGGELAFDKDAVSRSFGDLLQQKQSFASRLQSVGEQSIDRRRKSTNPGSVVRLNLLTLLRLECTTDTQSTQV